MAKIVDIDPEKRITREEWEKFRTWLLEVDPEKIGPVYIAFFSDAETKYESYSYGINWKMVGYLGAEVDTWKHALYNEELGDE